MEKNGVYALLVAHKKPIKAIKARIKQNYVQMVKFFNVLWFCIKICDISSKTIHGLNRNHLTKNFKYTKN